MGSWIMGKFFRASFLVFVCIAGAVSYLLFAPVTPAQVSMRITAACYVALAEGSLKRTGLDIPETFPSKSCGCIATRMADLGKPEAARLTESFRRLMVLRMAWLMSPATAMPGTAADERDVAEFGNALYRAMRMCTS
jgi:hypothetical protein